MSVSKSNKPFSPTPFKPPFWLTNPHLQSILPKFFAPKAPTYRRVVKRSIASGSLKRTHYTVHFEIRTLKCTIYTLHLTLYNLYFILEKKIKKIFTLYTLPVPFSAAGSLRVSDFP